MTVRPRRLLHLTLLATGLSFVAVAAAAYLTWPTNILGDYVRIWQAHQANIQSITRGMERLSDPRERRFYQAMLAEEKGDLVEAIRILRPLAEESEQGSPFRLKVTLRLGQAYGLKGDLEEELATYQALMRNYPGPSRISQAAFHLRRGDRQRAKILLDEALEQDTKDGSLGSDRRFAEHLRAVAGSGNRESKSPSR